MFIPPRDTQLDKLVKLAYIADADGCWYRNTSTLTKLKQLDRYRSQLIDALDEERSFLLDYVENLPMPDKFPTKLELGGWYYELFYKPESLYFPDFKLDVKLSPWSSDGFTNYEAVEGEDNWYESNNAVVRVY